MNTRYLFQSLVMTMLLSATALNAQFDDLYYDYSKDKEVVTMTEQTEYSDPSEAYYDNAEYNDNYEYDSEEYANYDEYSYASRISRFHHPSGNSYYYNSFDNWWYNDYYEPYYGGYGSSVNVYIGNGWGWNSWNRPWGWNYYYHNPFRYSYYYGWNSPWCYSGYYNSWGHHHYSPWGYNYYNPWSYGSNIYYGNVYYGNGWYNSNDNNNGSNSKTIYGSRKNGSVSSAARGREASPRRVVSGGSDGRTLTTDAVKETVDTRSDNDASRRTLKGDIKKSSETIKDTEVTRNRIYNRTDREGLNDGRENDMNRRNPDAVRESRRSSGNNSSIRQNESRPTDRSSMQRSSSPRQNSDIRSGRSFDRMQSTPTPRQQQSTPSRTFDSGSRRNDSSFGSSNLGSSRSSSGSTSRSSSGGARRG
ncbi:MAG: hypothetical protein J5I52_12315 [Saprospiraceae bacterium]|nr:MAG: serine/threonine protein kinase [Bacteroidetes bacterium OLB9]MCO6464920.1 hypothetical protein [Saprospiraceae bacterium]